MISAGSLLRRGAINADWQGVISMLVGYGDGDRRIHRRLQLFKVIYLAYWLHRIARSARAWMARRRGRQVAFAAETILSDMKYRDRAT